MHKQKHKQKRNAVSKTKRKQGTTTQDLTKLNKLTADGQEFDFHGDANKQLARAMKAFSSSFARANRRKLLRKHFLAFDVNNTQRISRAQFVDTVNEVGGKRRAVSYILRLTQYKQAARI